jgi:malate synthase
VKQLEDDELARLQASFEASPVPDRRLADAREVFDQVALSEQFVEFLTLPAYGRLE